MPNHSTVELGSLDSEARRIVEHLGGVWRCEGAMCRCPAHEDGSPSLSIRLGNRRLLLHCFAGCSATSVLDALGGLGLLSEAAAPSALPRTFPERRSRSGLAERLWREAGPTGGTPAELYLRSRGLDSMGSEALRFHAAVPCGSGQAAVRLPAMLAAVRDELGLVAVHRTFLDVRSGGLARMPSPKRALGSLGTAAVRLHPPVNGVLGLAEGVETALAAHRVSKIPCWAVLGAERFGRAELPQGVERLILFLDHDAGGRRADALARKRWAGLIEIEARWPRKSGADWNDQLLESVAPR